MKRNGDIKISLDITLEDIFDVLRKHNVPISVSNAKVVIGYLETTARDAARNALLDWSPGDNFIEVKESEAE